MINLEWFRTFSAIFECNNITEASKKLNMTQPGVSKHLAALEHHIGQKLFERTTRRLVATEYGKFLYSQINDPLHQLEKVEYYSSQRTKKERLAITIGCTTDFYKKELANKIYSLDMYIVLHFGNEKELAEALENDRIQLLVGVKEYKNYKHEFKLIKEQEMVVICSPDIEIPTNLHQDKNKKEKWLNKQNWFTFDNDLDDLKPVWKKDFNKVPKIVPRYVLPSYLDIIQALKTNTGIAIVPKQLCTEEVENGLVQTPFSTLNKAVQQLYFSYKLKNRNLRSIDQFMDKIGNGSLL